MPTSPPAARWSTTGAWRGCDGPTPLSPAAAAAAAPATSTASGRRCRLHRETVLIVRRSALVEQPATHLFDLIEAAEHYPQFLPWCAGARIVERDDVLVSADIRFNWHGVNFEMRTRNPKQRPDYMAIHLESGPFRRFEGEWRLTALGDEACKVAFTLDYEFSSSMMTRATGPMFDHVANTLVDAFVMRSQAMPWR